MRERALAFGSHGGLVGVLSEPDGGADPRAPAALLFNVGLNHRVGPGRLNVELARELAGRGYAALRFDLSGLGDSLPREDVRSDAERAILDLREAMDLAQQRLGCSRFVVVGLCSGTDGAHELALADPRVAGAVFIDGYAYPTFGYHARRWAERARWLSEPFRWRRMLRRRLRRLRGLDADARAATWASEPVFERTYPTRERFRRDLEAMLGRGAQLLFVYSADAWSFNHEPQFAPMVGWRALPPALEVRRLAGADHVFSTSEARGQLIAALVGWCARRFPNAAVPGLARPAAPVPEPMAVPGRVRAPAPGMARAAG